MKNNFPSDPAATMERPKRLAAYTFFPRQSAQGQGRDIAVGYYDDNTVVWDDATQRLKNYPGVVRVLAALYTGKDNGSEADRPYFVTTEADPLVKGMFERIAHLESRGQKVTAKTAKLLNDFLEAKFWIEVNEKLPSPIAKRAE
jgi:hypothetical protein